MREGQKIVCKVLRVDPTKGHIDLSLKQVNEHQRREKIQEWKNEQKAEKLFAMVAENIGKDVKQCYEEFGYDLMETFGSLYRAFEECSLDPEILKSEGFRGEWIQPFLQVAKDNIVPSFVKIDGFLELRCPAGDGAVHIREALILAKKENLAKVTVQYIGAPRYRLVVTAPDYKTAEEEIQLAARRAIDYIVSKGGEGRFQRKE